MKNTVFLLGAMLAASLAQAHVTLEQNVAPAGAYQKLTFRVGHGCAQSATHTVTVALPEALAGAKPMPKAGWSVSASKQEVSWTGGPLPDAYYDEFVMQVKLPAAPGKLYFKVSQLCEKGRVAWNEIPAGDAAKLKFPAPALDVLPATAGGHHH